MEDSKEPVFTWQDLNDNPPPSRKIIWLRVGEEAFVGSRIVYKDEWNFLRGKESKKKMWLYTNMQTGSLWKNNQLNGVV